MSAPRTSRKPTTLPTSSASISPPASSNAAAQVRREAHRECHHREGRIRLAGGGEDRAARHVQVLKAVNTAVGIHDAGARVAAHPGGPEMVATVRAVARHLQFDARRVVVKRTDP